MTNDSRLQPIRATQGPWLWRNYKALVKKFPLNPRSVWYPYNSQRFQKKPLTYFPPHSSGKLTYLDKQLTSAPCHYEALLSRCFPAVTAKTFPDPVLCILLHPSHGSPLRLMQSSLSQRSFCFRAAIPFLNQAFHSSNCRRWTDWECYCYHRWVCALDVDGDNPCLLPDILHSLFFVARYICLVWFDLV